MKKTVRKELAMGRCALLAEDFCVGLDLLRID
jgi:hypothetical protein